MKGRQGSSGVVNEPSHDSIKNTELWMFQCDRTQNIWLVASASSGCKTAKWGWNQWQKALDSSDRGLAGWGGLFDQEKNKNLPLSEAHFYLWD